MKLTANDERVLAALDDACTRFDGFMPHGAADWTAIKRLERAGLIRHIGFARCQDCEEHEGDAFTRSLDLGVRK